MYTQSVRLAIQQELEEGEGTGATQKVFSHLIEPSPAVTNTV